MSRMMFAMAIVAIAIGCKQKPADEMGASSGQSGAMGTSGDIGSAMGTKMHDAAPGTALVDAATPKTPDEIAKRYDEYTAAHPSHEPQLVMISGNTIIAMVLVDPDKPHLLGQVIETDPYGKFTSETTFFDARLARVSRGLPTKLALIAKNDEIERTNLATLEKMMDASEKKDLATFGSLIADDVVWSVQTRPKDLTKQEIMAAIEQRLAKTDLRYTLEKSWAAGDYVASIERVVGTATADSPDKTIKKGDKIDRRLLAVHRFAGGKLAEVWVFPQP